MGGVGFFGREGLIVCTGERRRLSAGIRAIRNL